MRIVAGSKASKLLGLTVVVFVGSIVWLGMRPPAVHLHEIVLSPAGINLRVLESGTGEPAILILTTQSDHEAALARLVELLADDHRTVQVTLNNMDRLDTLEVADLLDQTILAIRNRVASPDGTVLLLIGITGAMEYANSGRHEGMTFVLHEDSPELASLALEWAQSSRPDSRSGGSVVFLAGESYAQLAAAIGSTPNFADRFVLLMDCEGIISVDCANPLSRLIKADIAMGLSGSHTGEVLEDTGVNFSGPRIITIPAGTYLMGDSTGAGSKDARPQHRVTLALPFGIAEREVTVAEFRRFVEQTDYQVEPGCWNHDLDQEWRFYASLNWQSPGFVQGDDHPVTCVSWNDARAFTDWLSQKTQAVYRLPTEAELEYIIRAGHQHEIHMAAGEPGRLCQFMNAADTSSGWDYANQACDDGYRHTAPVATFRSNGFGLFDTSGNLWEWAEDCWNDSYAIGLLGMWKAPDDGGAWKRGGCRNHVTRGGSWLSSVIRIRPAFRQENARDYRLNSIGFRPVREFRQPARY